MSFKKLIPLLFIILFFSCTSDDEISKERRALNQARLTWENSQLKSYSFNEKISCFCGGLLEWKVYVKNEVKDKVEFDESRLAPDQTYDDIFNNAKTIEDAFDFINSLLSQDLASLVVEYNQKYGFPSLISIDYNANTADDEIAYSYTDFEITN